MLIANRAMLQLGYVTDPLCEKWKSGSKFEIAIHKLTESLTDREFMYSN